ncbi:hypothetical protein BN3662_00675 [Clostridiales bacterium CHKCI006]|jgi:hypothetical protein|nr:hypothetical protein BN3662_00675 [Clostridiales bacterium CHKCI006]
MNSEDFIRIAEYIKENYVSKEEWENDLVAHTLINIQYSIEHIEKILEKLCTDKEVQKNEDICF